MITLAPPPRSTAADLMRLLAVWLAAIVLVQGVAAAQALGFGPLHRHAAAALHDDRHHHDGAQRHHHAAADGSVLAVAAVEPAFDAAAFALVAALALMALGHWRFTAQAQRSVMRAARAWACRCFIPALLLRPPNLR